MAAKADELGAVIARIKEEREPLLGTILKDAIAFSDVENWNLIAENKRWFPNDEAQATFQARIAQTSEFSKFWVDLSWLPDVKPTVAIPKVVPEVSASVVTEGEQWASASPSSPPFSSSSPSPITESRSELTPTLSSPSPSAEKSLSDRPEPLPSAPLRATGINPALTEFLTTLDVDWSTVAPRAARGDGGMIVGSGLGVMLGVASKAKDTVPVSSEIVLPSTLRFSTNNGSGARCFLYSVVMGLTGLPQGEVEDAVRQIAVRADVGGGWIASDSEVAQRVIAEVERMFGVQIQVVELQNSVAGLQISGRSHDATPEARRPIVIRNTGAHYDAII